LQQDSELSVGMADTLQDLLMIARAWSLSNFYYG
jgi:hypothetical protein